MVRQHHAVHDHAVPGAQLTDLRTLGERFAQPLKAKTEEPVGA
jgi:hypothetical protein